MTLRLGQVGYLSPQPHHLMLFVWSVGPVVIEEKGRWWLHKNNLMDDRTMTHLWNGFGGADPTSANGDTCTSMAFPLRVFSVHFEMKVSSAYQGD